MNSTVLLLLSVLLLILTGNLVILGLDWITIYHGLNPFIAFPLALVTAVLAVVTGTIGARKL
jgi:hypothetical protein